MSLSDFLKERQAELKEKKPSSLVIGNPAGDADSILSALCWSFVASTAVPIDGEKTLTTPILSISRHDLQSQRPETTTLLQWANIDVESLVDVEDVTRNDSSRFSAVPVTLVDHNQLDSAFSSLDWTVAAILDHHYDQGAHTDTCTLRDIAFANDHATVASTTTLVAERWLEALGSSSSKSSLPSDVAILLLGTILLDSVNMQPSAGKGTPRDQAMLDALLDRTDWHDGKLTIPDSDENLWDNDTRRPVPDRIFERLQEAKFDVGFWKGLSVRDALRLDYKEFTPNNNDGIAPFGASTVLLDWETFQNKSDVSGGILDYMRDSNISFLAIMCTFTSGESDALQRQLILCAKDDADLVDNVVEYLENLDADNNLKLTKQSNARLTAEGLTLRAFDQGKVKASRKQVAPLLIRFFETCLD